MKVTIKDAMFYSAIAYAATITTIVMDDRSDVADFQARLYSTFVDSGVYTPRDGAPLLSTNEFRTLSKEKRDSVLESITKALRVVLCNSPSVD